MSGIFQGTVDDYRVRCICHPAGFWQAARSDHDYKVESGLRTKPKTKYERNSIHQEMTDEQILTRYFVIYFYYSRIYQWYIRLYVYINDTLG